MFKSRMTMLLSCIAAMIPLILYWYLYPTMPDFVPIHYDGAAPDRFVHKWSVEVVLLSGLGWFGLIFVKLLQCLLRKLFLQSYVENLAAVSRVWNAAILFVTILFSAISVYALTAMG